ncbi:disease resistance protein TAO1-like [Punica granatum]|uniref:Disease resistance protein TAO1-like n=2 Tax=Punica granatum TaxID=22663 RepID=A0A6P8CXG0_PUNGR|nr:disease resistance protein TAO1-like [Punica granatum]
MMDDHGINDDDEEAVLPSSRYRWDIFLSFRGEDTRHGFTDRLYKALWLDGVRTFRDDEGLERGDEVAPGLLEAIQDSAGAVAVISERYADSRWCLEELATIFEGKKLLLPVFYDVDPSDVRRQRGPFEAGFRKLEESCGAEKVQRWRQAMEKAGNISGWVSKVWEEQEMIRSLVERILKKLKNTPLGVAKYPVGLEARLEELKGMIDANANGVLALGFYGMGGVGKTTLAKALFNKLVGHFRLRSFVSNIRESSSLPGGLDSLQAKLIGDLTSSNVSPPGGVRNGILRIKELTFEQSALIVLDDVHDVGQLNALAGGRDWFYEGSRIIITSRDRDLLPESIVNVFYEVKKLSLPESIQLFSFHALGRHEPPRNLSKLTEQIVDLTGGLPLALEVFGSYLYDKRDVKDWQDAVQKLQRVRPGHLQSVLEISFDALDREEKSVFLDIACFFVKMRMTREDAIYAFRAFNFNAGITIKVLAAKSLLKVTEDEILWMHDQIRDMGREIVQRECDYYPGKRSRLWDRDEILTVLKNKAGTEKIQGITLDLEKKHESSSTTNIGKHHQARDWGLTSIVPYLKQKFKNCSSHEGDKNGNERGLTVLHTSSFTRMVHLRLLQINHVTLRGSSKTMPSGIKWLQWKGCPLEVLPLSSFLRQLGVLDLSESSFTKISMSSGWNTFRESKTDKKLLVMDLHACNQLTEIPDLSNYQGLEKLILAGCTRLVEIHKSVGDMTSLLTLDLSRCSNLRKFPDDISGLKNLEKLVLSDCVQMMELPEDMGGMASLKELLLDSTAILKLPESIFRLQKLEKVSLKYCQSLKQLPGCIGGLSSLKELILDSSSLEELPNSIGSLAKLEKLSLIYCRSLTALPDSVGSLQSLTHLLLGNTSLTHLPATIGSLSRLKLLSLNYCRKLSELPESIGGLSSLVWLDLVSTSVERVPSQIGALKMLKNLEMAYCRSLRLVPESLGNLLSLTSLNLNEAPITELPESIGTLERLSTLRLNSCRNLRKLPAAIGNLKSLVDLSMKETAVVALPEEFGMLSSLQYLMMRKEPKPDVEEKSEQTEIVLPRTFSGLCSLKELDAHACRLSGIPNDFEKIRTLEVLKLGFNKFHSLPSSLRGLELLKDLILTNCRELRSLPQLPSSLTKLDASNCTSLESIRDLGNLEQLQELNLTNCYKVVDIPGLQVMKSLRRLFLGGCTSCAAAVKKRLEKVALRHLYNLSIPASDIPSWFSQEITSFTPRKNRELRGIIVAVVVSLSDENPNNIKSRLPAIVDVKARVVRDNVELHTTVLNLMGVPEANEEQLYLIRFPDFKPIVKMLEEGDKIQITLREMPYFPGIQLKKHGVYPVFENDDDYAGNEEWLDPSQQSVSQKLARFIGSL